jgi:hypothetical protein
MSDILKPGDRVRFIDAPLPPPYAWQWINFRPGMEGVVVDGPIPLDPHHVVGEIKSSAGAKCGWAVRFVSCSDEVLDILLQKLDDPPPEEDDLPTVEDFDLEAIR